jgi:hypothetical protein
MMMNFMAHHHSQLAAFAAQQNMSQERAMEVLYQTLKQQQAQPSQVVQILQQTLNNPQLPPNEPKQPPPSYGAAKAVTKQRPATFPFPFSAPVVLKPTPVPVPTLPAATQATAAAILPPDAPMTQAEPVRITRSRSRVTAPRGKGRAKKQDAEEEVPVLSTRASSRAPSVVVPDTPMPSALKRAASQDAERVPVAFTKPAARKKRPASAGEQVPVIRAKARPRKTIDPETPQAPRRSRSRAARSQSETELVPVQMNGRGAASRSRPPRAASETPVLMDAVRVAAAALGEDGADVIPMVKELRQKNKTARTQQKPSVKIDRGKIKIDREALRAQIKRIKLNTVAEEVVKRGRGRPAGSKNKETLARAMAAA